MARYRVYRNISCLVTNQGIKNKDGIRPREADLGLVTNGAIAFDEKIGVLWVGEDKKLPRTFKEKKWKHLSCKKLVAYPGLVDSHTHPAFLGDRSREFSLRMRGASYQEIAAAGGGILSSMRATREGGPAELRKAIAHRICSAYSYGVRLLEAKSGYGLSFESELRSLEAIKAAAKKFTNIEIQGTCMAAHAVPPEFKGRTSAYVSEICEKLLPIVSKKKLARYVDIFIDKGYFDLEDAKRLLSAAQTYGLGFRLHGEELAHTGAAEFAAESGALSVDHLLKISDLGIEKLAQSSTVATLLPGTSLYLREPPAPARKLIDNGVRVALATDFNPGSCPTQNLPFIGTLAALHLEMTTAEIICALTWNGAKSLESTARFGALLPGYIGEPIFCEGDHPSALFYHLASGPLPQP